MIKRMVAWLKDNWRWTLLNLVALAILATLVRNATVIRWPPERSTSDLFFTESGRWAIRFLLFSLAMTPADVLFGWRWVIPLRKPAGLWAFCFAALHFGYYVLVSKGFNPVWLIGSPFMLIGFCALTILTLMAFTSNQRTMKWPGKNWKRLHRLVYVVGILVLIHVVLALQNSKKAYMNPLWYPEFIVYGIILAILLALRVPPMRRAIARLLSWTGIKIKRKRGGLVAK